MDGSTSPVKEASLRNIAAINAATAAVRSNGTPAGPVGATSAMSAAATPTAMLLPKGNGHSNADTPTAALPVLGGPGSLCRGLPRYVRQPPIEAVVFAWGVNEDGQLGNLDSTADVMQPKVRTHACPLHLRGGGGTRHGTGIGFGEGAS